MASGIKEIALEAGVSVGAVSQALNGYGRMSEEKRAKVLAIAKKLRYRPNLLVEAIQSGMTKTIGVMMSQGTDFHSKICKGICDKTGEYGYAPFFISPGREEETYDKCIEFQIKQLHRLVDRRIDGLIIMSSDPKIGSSELVNEINFRCLPKVILDLALPGIDGDFSGVDNEEGGKIAAMHFAENGHKKAGIICLSSKLSSSEERKKGFLKAAKTVKLQCLVHNRSDFAPSGHFTDLTELLKSNRDMTAIFCLSDYMALDVYRAAAELKLRIPEDLSVCGFGNTVVGEYMSPALSSIDQFAEEEGREAVRLIMDRLSGKQIDGPVRNLLKPELIIRKSIAKNEGKG